MTQDKTVGKEIQTAIDDMTIDKIIDKHFDWVDQSQFCNTFILRSYKERTHLLRPKKKSAIEIYEIYEFENKDGMSHLVMEGYDEDIIMVKNYEFVDGISLLYGYLIDRSLNNNPGRPYLLPTQEGIYKSYFEHVSNIIGLGIIAGMVTVWGAYTVAEQSLLSSIGTGGVVNFLASTLVARLLHKGGYAPNDRVTKQYEENQEYHRRFLDYCTEQWDNVFIGRDAVLQELKKIDYKH